MADILYRDFGDSNGDIVLVLNYRLFINGVDVTDHVLGSISWSYNEGGSENTCSFTLDNNNNKFILRPENLGLEETGTTKSFADTDEFSTSEPWKITKMTPTGKGVKFISSKQAEGMGLTTYSETAKSAMYLWKVKTRVKLETQDNEKYQLKGMTDKLTGAVTGTPTEDISLYEGLFHSHGQVINIMDQVRLYVMDPNRDPVDAYDSLWIPAFTGFVVSAPPETDYTTGQSSINVECGDIRVLLKRKRVLVNSASADQIQPAISNRNGLFSDVVLQNTNTANAFSDSSLNFEKLVALALMGIRFPDGDSSNQASNFRDYCLKPSDDPNNSAYQQLRMNCQERNEEGRRFNKNGFGGLWFGYYYMYDTALAADVDEDTPNPKRAEFMNAWNRLTVFGMTKDYLSWDEMQTQGLETKVGGAFSALNTYVHMLVPSGGNQVTNLMDKQMIDQMGVQREYMSVGEVIEQVCERIDYKYSVTGAGDIVFEFPMYDFTAQDQGDEFKAVYSVSDSVISDSINDEANSNPITSLKVVGGLTDQLQGIQGINDTIRAYKYTVYIMHDLLAARYGYAEEEYQVPFVTNGPNNQQSDQDYQRVLAMFGCFEFIKRLTEMSAMSVSAAYNPFARCNRPYYYNYGRRLAVTTSIQNTLSLFQNASTTVDSKYVRRIHDITGQVVAFGGSMSGTTGYLNGASALPLNYSSKATLDVFFDNDKYLDFVQDLFNSGINIQIPSGAGAVGASNTQFKSLSTQAGNQRLCAWSKETKAAFDNLCSKYGIPAKNLMAVIAVETGGTYASTGKHAINSSLGKNPYTGKAMKTYALGMFQMLPVNIVQTLRNHPDLAARYNAYGDGIDPSSNLTHDRYIRKSKSNTRLYTPDSLSGKDGDFSNKEAFAAAFMRCFGTPQAQIELYELFIQDSLKSNGLNQSYRLDTVEKMAMLQSSTGNLRNVSNLSKLDSTSRQHYQQYLNLLNSRVVSAGESYASMANGCASSDDAASSVPAPMLPYKDKPVLSPTGTGNVPLSFFDEFKIVR